jgi:formate dehydrogenase major subunit
MLSVIVTEKLYDQQYIQTYVEGFEAWKENVKDFTPEEMAPICGIDADTLRSRARLRPRRKRDHLLGHGRGPAHPRH